MIELIINKFLWMLVDSQAAIIGTVDFFCIISYKCISWSWKSYKNVMPKLTSAVTIIIRTKVNMRKRRKVQFLEWTYWLYTFSVVAICPVNNTFSASLKYSWGDSMETMVASLYFDELVGKHSAVGELKRPHSPSQRIRYQAVLIVDSHQQHRVKGRAGQTQWWCSDNWR